MKNKIIEDNRANFLIACFLVVLTMGIYLQVRNHAFVGYDDDSYVTENVHIQNGLTTQGILWTFTSIVLGNWHPVTWLSHQLDVQLFGMKPGAHHLMNVLFHVLNTLLLFAVMKRMSGEIWKSCLVAALFAVHPLHVESVAWIAERKDLLSAFFWLLTMLCYVLYTERLNKSMYLLSLLFFILGLMSKPMLVTLPFALLLLDYWPLKRFQFQATGNDFTMRAILLNVRPLIREKFLFFLFSFVSCVVTFSVQHGGGSVASFQIFPLEIRIANALVAYVEYIAKMFWPAKLAVLYPHPGTLPLWKATAAIIILASVSYLAFKNIRKYPWFCVGWLWYLGTLIPVIGLVQVGVQSMADRYTYLPLIGLFIILAWGVPKLLPNRKLRPFYFFPAATTVILALALTSWCQVGHWSNSTSLFKHAISVTDNNYIMHHNLAFELQALGMTTEALEHYSTALEINPNFADAHINIGFILANQGKYEAAVERFQQAMRINPDTVKGHLNLGYTRLRQGNAGDALRHYSNALLIDPYSAEAYNGLGAAMVKIGKIQQAITYFRKALQLDPEDAAAKQNLSNTLAAQKKLHPNEGFQDSRAQGFE